jgi:hypothetical protein
MKTDPIASITIRRLTEEDRGALLHLAGLDSEHAPDGDLLGAEIEGRLVAAISLGTGDSIADPFSRTQETRALLELRRTQLQARERSRRRTLRARRAGRPRAALASSPPGAGGRLLALPYRPS